MNVNKSILLFALMFTSTFPMQQCDSVSLDMALQSTHLSFIEKSNYIRQYSQTATLDHFNLLACQDRLPEDLAMRMVEKIQELPDWQIAVMKGQVLSGDVCGHGNGEQFFSILNQHGIFNDVRYISALDQPSLNFSRLFKMRYASLSTKFFMGILRNVASIHQSCNAHEKIEQLSNINNAHQYDWNPIAVFLSQSDLETIQTIRFICSLLILDCHQEIKKVEIVNSWLNIRGILKKIDSLSWLYDVDNLCMIHSQEEWNSKVHQNKYNIQKVMPQCIKVLDFFCDEYEKNYPYQTECDRETIAIIRAAFLSLKNYGMVITDSLAQLVRE